MKYEFQVEGIQKWSFSEGGRKIEKVLLRWKFLN